MLRRQLLREASSVVGHHISENSLKHAMRCGYLDEAERRPDRYREYTAKHAQQLVTYVRSRSRVVPGDPEHIPTAGKDDA